MSRDGAPAVLRDERDLLWLLLEEFRADGSDIVFDVHFLARQEPTEPPRPFLSARGYREPVEGFLQVLERLGEAVTGGLSAMRLDPIADGLSIELKRRNEAGQELFEVVLWLDLVRMGRAMRARANRGRQQAGLRFFATREGVEEFRAALMDAAFPEALH
jgi:hypothetical protein